MLCWIKKFFSKGMNRDRVFEQLKFDEGVVYEIYADPLGYPTFGVGHLITDSDPEAGQPIGTAVSEQRVWSAFESDLDISVSECHALYGEGTFNGFPAEVQEILVNMMFNMGRNRLSKFKKMNAALLESDWAEAAVEGRDSLWYQQVTKRAERLMTRMENVA